MPREWTDDEVEKEIRDAVQIVRADRIDALISKRLGASNNDTNNPSGNPPPSGDNGPPTPKKRSLFWGEET